MKISTLQEALMDELQDLLDAEKQLVRALPKMAKAAADEQLRNAFTEHLEVTKNQVTRLEQVFGSLGAKPRSKPCRGMRGIVEEGQEIISEGREKPVLNTGIASAARKVEHYEIVGYESVRKVARQLGHREAVQLLEQTLKEEMDMDKLLVGLSNRLVKEASQGGAEQPRQRKTQQAVRRQPAARSRSARGQGSAHPLTDHEQIRQWAEQRGAQPACVRGTGGRGDVGMIRLDFPGFSGEQSLEPVSWDDWFQKFDQSELALMVAGGSSNFNKLVGRQSAASKQRPRARKAGG